MSTVGGCIPINNLSYVKEFITTTYRTRHKAKVYEISFVGFLLVYCFSYFSRQNKVAVSQFLSMREVFMVVRWRGYRYYDGRSYEGALSDLEAYVISTSLSITWSKGMKHFRRLSVLRRPWSGRLFSVHSAQKVFYNSSHERGRYDVIDSFEPDQTRDHRDKRLCDCWVCMTCCGSRDNLQESLADARDTGDSSARIWRPQGKKI